MAALVVTLWRAQPVAFRHSWKSLPQAVGVWLRHRSVTIAKTSFATSTDDCLWSPDRLATGPALRPPASADGLHWRGAVIHWRGLARWGGRR